MAKFLMTRIEPPEWALQPSLTIFRVTVSEYAAIQRYRGRLLEAVHQEIETYLNDRRLTFGGDEEGFPSRSRLNGAYYIASESYRAHTDPPWFQISVMCHCLERQKAGMVQDDYLGLEVWLRCAPGAESEFEVFRNTDSSSI